MSRKKLRETVNKLCPLGLRIKKLQEINELKAYELALMLGISESYLSDIKHGRSGERGYLFWNSMQNKLPGWEDYLKGKEKNPQKRIKIIRIYNDEHKLVNIMPEAHVEYKIETTRPAGQAIEPVGLHGNTRHLKTEAGMVPVTLFKPDDKWYHDKLDDIMCCEDNEIIHAVQSVIVACANKMEKGSILEARVTKLEEELQLKKKVSRVTKVNGNTDVGN